MVAPKPVGLNSPPARPWASLGVALLAVVALAMPEALVYERLALARGELWRLWTGHLVHFGPSHLAYDLCVFLFAGIWLEKRAPGRLRLLLVGVPPLIGAGLYFLDPQLFRYGGLSGLGAGLLAILALVLGREARWRGLGWSLGVLLGGKMILEQWGTDRPLLVDFKGVAIQSVPWAHVLGVLAALSLWLFFSGVNQARQRFGPSEDSASRR